MLDSYWSQLITTGVVDITSVIRRQATDQEGEAPWGDYGLPDAEPVTLDGRPVTAPVSVSTRPLHETSEPKAYQGMACLPIVAPDGSQAVRVGVDEAGAPQPEPPPGRPEEVATSKQTYTPGYCILGSEGSRIRWCPASRRAIWPLRD